MNILDAARQAAQTVPPEHRELIAKAAERVVVLQASRVAGGELSEIAQQAAANNLAEIKSIAALYLEDTVRRTWEILIDRLAPAVGALIKGAAI